MSYILKIYAFAVYNSVMIGYNIDIHSGENPLIMAPESPEPEGTKEKIHDL